MNLIIATGIYPPDIGGPATYSKKLAEEFSKRGWDVTVLTYANLRECESPSRLVSGAETGGSARNFKVTQVSRNYNVFARYFLYTYKLIILARKADLIYAQGPVSEGLPAYFTSKLLGKKYVLKVVGDCAWERRGAGKQKNKKTRNQEIKKSKNQLNVETRFITSKMGFIGLDEFQTMRGLPLKTKILKWTERLVAKNAEKVIVPSGYLKKIVNMWGVNLEKIKVIYNAVEKEKKGKEGEKGEEGKNGEESFRDLEIHDGKEDIILSVGRLVPWKGFDTLINVMPDLWIINPNLKLVIVGDGPEYENLKFQISSFKFKKLNDKIILTGKLEHKEVLQLMREAKIFVLNSGYEGLSHSVIEAMQAGLPCAVSDIGGNPELVENEKTGLLFEYNNEEEIKMMIARLWKDKILCERVVVGAREKVGQFSFERMIRETKEILNFKF